MTYQPISHTIVAMDVVGSGSRDDQLLLRMRADLRQIVAATLAAQSLDLSSLETHDLGDGLRFLVPALVSPRALLDPFIPQLDQALGAHRRASSEAARLRLRVSIHHGLVHDDEGHSAGEPLKLVMRLLDADPVRTAIAAVPEANLALVVSRDLYESVVKHHYGLSVDLYQRVAVHAKELITEAWIHLPGFRPPYLVEPTEQLVEPAESGSPGPSPRGEGAGSTRRSTVHINATTATFQGPVVGGDFHG